MTSELNHKAYALSTSLALDIMDTVAETPFGCSIDKMKLDKALTKYEIDLSDSFLIAILIGRIYAEDDCAYMRVAQLGHYFYHVFIGDAPALSELLEEEERVVAGSGGSVH